MSIISDRNSETNSAEDRDGISLSDHVTAGATNQKVTHKVKTDATIESISFRIYTGPELSLQLYPFVKKTNGTTHPLLEFAGKEYIDGDDDKYPFDLSKEIESGDEIVIEATNTDGSNAYDYRVNVGVERAGGLSRLLGGVL